MDVTNVPNRHKKSGIKGDFLIIFLDFGGVGCTFSLADTVQLTAGYT